MATRMLIVQVRTGRKRDPGLDPELARILGGPPGAYLSFPGGREAWWYLPSDAASRSRLRRLRGLTGLEIVVERAKGDRVRPRL